MRRSPLGLHRVRRTGSPRHACEWVRGIHRARAPCQAESSSPPEGQDPVIKGVLVSESLRPDATLTCPPLRITTLSRITVDNATADQPGCRFSSELALSHGDGARLGAPTTTSPPNSACAA